MQGEAAGSKSESGAPAGTPPITKELTRRLPVKSKETGRLFKLSRAYNAE